MANERRLPPMTSLPVFEAVGRHLSVARAAGELHLTPGAVSRQIRNLEAHLGSPLFERGHRRIVFTDAGRSYWARVHAALTEIRAATEETSTDAEKRPLIISCPRVFLQKCLIPSLGALYERHPAIELSLIVEGADSDAADGSIIVGRKPRSDQMIDRLVAGDLFPVCSPGYLRRAPPLERPEDLTRHTLLRSAEFTRNWEKWLGLRAPEVFASTRFINFESSGLELPAAVEGLGVAIVRAPLVRDELARNELVVLFSELRVPEHYCFAFSDSRLRSPSFRLFRSWLKQTFGDQPAQGADSVKGATVSS